VGEQPKNKRKSSAEDKTSNDGKVERSVLAAVHDVTGQFSQAEGKLVSKVKKSAEKDEESAEEKERAAEFAKGIHEEIVEELEEGNNDAKRRRLKRTCPVNNG
jgi:hypothetical protein